MLQLTCFSHWCNEGGQGNLAPPPARAYLRGGGVQGVQTPPKFSDFFLKSEGKEIEKKIKKGFGRGGGGVTVPLIIFLGLIFCRVGLRYFQGGLRNFREGLRNFRGGLRNFRGVLRNFRGGGLKNFRGGGG